MLKIDFANARRYCVKSHNRGRVNSDGYTARRAAGLALKLVDVPTVQNRLLRCDPAMRGFEWWLLWGRSDSSLATLYTDSLFAGVTDPATGMAFSVDRRRISSPRA